MAPSTNTFDFLSLPRELRQIIYEYKILLSPHIIRMPHPQSHPITIPSIQKTSPLFVVKRRGLESSRFPRDCPWVRAHPVLSTDQNENNNVNQSGSGPGIHHDSLALVSRVVRDEFLNVLASRFCMCVDLRKLLLRKDAGPYAAHGKEERACSPPSLRRTQHVLVELSSVVDVPVFLSGGAVEAVKTRGREIRMLLESAFPALRSITFKGSYWDMPMCQVMSVNVRGSDDGSGGGQSWLKDYPLNRMDCKFAGGKWTVCYRWGLEEYFGREVVLRVLREFVEEFPVSERYGHLGFERCVSKTLG
ncbi:MAG: hypothetical protein M1831_006693 [Alyxoria varia]|nr:MAG: hypothetical protein M1831_006693 [Alyxoria varia]